MVQIYLVDDNKLLLERNQNMLSAFAQRNNIQADFVHFRSGEELLAQLEDNPNKADVIFLDVLMGGISGTATAKRLRAMGCHSEIIFLTSSEEFVFESFDSQPLRYVIKGSAGEAQLLEEVFLKAVQISLRKNEEAFLYKTKEGDEEICCSIPIVSISYLKCNEGEAVIYCQEGIFNFHSNMEELVAQLKDKGFVQCHKSYLVNLQYIEDIKKNEIVLTTGEVIPLGKNYSKEVKLSFSASLSEII